MMRHAVFVECAELLRARRAEGDHHLSDVFLAMAYGLYPFCVQDERHGRALLFRRVGVPADKDKDRTRRMSDAVDALQRLSGVQQYHASLEDANLQLHVQGPLPTVSWPIALPAETHVCVVPDLLRWTQWDVVEHAWPDLRETVAASVLDREPPTPQQSQPRHLRLAQILDFVGERAHAEGRSYDQCIALCKRVSALTSIGQVQVDTDPQTGEVRDVRY